jgi:L-2,4-diaminobutyric acid acetyltransferase
MDALLSHAMITTPTDKDAVAIWRLVEDSNTLDHNSFYCYFLLCSHFKETCAVAKNNGTVVGFASAFRLPAQPDTLFIWQIRVMDEMRGKGLGPALIADILRRPSSKDINLIEATISPDNVASQSLFRSIAKKLKTAISVHPDFLRIDMLPSEIRNHEPEYLFRVGPFANN